MTDSKFQDTHDDGSSIFVSIWKLPKHSLHKYAYLLQCFMAFIGYVVFAI